MSRALEVFELSGETISSLQAKHAFATRRYDARLFAIPVEPHVLRARIEARARAWLEAGWVAEVRALIDDGFERARAMGSVGFAEIRDAIASGGASEPELLANIVQHTHVFARRQRTWLSHEPVRWVQP